ncbi:collagenase [Streptomyces sp. TLI_171]|uniref:collagenase n=1 Tax=Streptomyces sp. TLI_171 TaxID=1938859 RepID=UPI000C179DAF|nr:collagenase [Streptomyces sp. TLI_171]RKE18974.1 collagenase [Streptomyces sp. TLI_171]
MRKEQRGRARITFRSRVFPQVTYDNSGSTRVYNWGYLAVRYLLRSHPQDVAAYLAKTRTGDFTGARALLTGIGTSCDADFAGYLAACGAGDCGTLAPAAPLCTHQDTRWFEQDSRRDDTAAATGNYSYAFLNPRPA